MRRSFAVSGVAALGALALVGCGGSGSSGGSSGSSAAPAKTVSVQQIGGTGRVLVNAHGRALYTPAQEANGKVMCTGACLKFWQPLSPGAGMPTGGSGVGKLAVITRPDGTKQVTAAGKPLYTFSQDRPGQVTGNGFNDAFGGRHFTWHAVLAGGGRSGAPASSSSTGGGYRAY